MSKNKKLSAKLFFTLVTGISLVIFAALYIEFRLSKRFINYQTQSLAANSIRFQSIEITEELETFRRLSQNVAVLISSVEMDSVQVERLQQLVFKLSEKIHGTGIVISDASGEKPRFQRYLYRQHGMLNNIPALPYNIESILQLSSKNGPVPVISSIGDTLFVFHSLYLSQKENTEVFLTIDFSPAFIVSNFEKIAKTFDSQYIILDESNAILFHNYETALSDEGYEAEPDSRFRRNYRAIKDLLKKDTETFIPSKEFNKNESVFILPLPEIQWHCCFFIPNNKLNRKLVRHFLMVSLISILAVAIAGVIISYYSRKITGPISLISKAIKILENGNIYSDLPEIDTEDELEDIANSFHKVQAKMQHYATGFKSSLEEKRSMAHDLRMANRIQESMLPDQFLGFPDFQEINLFTRLVPAKGVAGDFFDYCFLDRNHFFFVVGDVSGKGMPAALYMVKVLTLLRTQRIRSLPLNQMFTEISNALSSMNSDGSFVTAVGGVLNYTSGELILCDAGHNPPFISKNGKKFVHLDLNKNLPLGVVADTSYKETKLQLDREDALFLYTDGLPEAANQESNLFGDERIIETLSGQQNKKLEIIFNYLKNSLINFVGKAKQADDITIFLLRYMKS